MQSLEQVYAAHNSLQGTVDISLPQLKVLDLSENKIQSAHISAPGLLEFKINKNLLRELNLNSPRLELAELQNNQL